MSLALLEAVEGLTSAHDEAQLRLLDEAICASDPKKLGQPEFSALLSVFERFPEEDGYETFWAIVHCLEACSGYEPPLIESATRNPVEFNLLMVNRLLNAGITEVMGHSLLSVLSSAASNPRALESARRSAQGFIDYQGKQGRTDA